MMKKIFSCMALLGFASVSQAAIISTTFTGNDCSGVFGTGFDSCAITVGDTTLSPVIAKLNFDDFGNVATTETNSAFSTVDGTEFDVTGAGSAAGTWSYTPDNVDDPDVRYWVAKGANAFNLFWQVDDAELLAGGACDVADVFSLACLSAAQVVESGDWNTSGLGKRNDPSISHITFYDTAVVPVPASVWLFGSGLLGLVGVARRKRI